MPLFHLIFHLSIYVALMGCQASTTTQSGMINIEAKIAQYQSQAVHDSFEDGAFAVYDVATLQIRSPDSLKNSELTVWLTPQDQAEHWQRVGQIITFSLDSSLLTAAAIYEAALENLQIK